ncbi:Cytochrome oxidase Cu insertion factor, SCO1/SenC/PrrC family [Fictibacillus solisalsi]|uniref:Cytochrome oxidase Cu insertion factor, SCO1/SenC/PrrC family n=1 Tax=Fictibacillus solisalsi TaxID=459525 RepID=A0A1G9WLE0_9BACL|nr:SCO family protein [Fictibacillus solisalsi]SDM85354.1 Cytochrome oxidase Cu insertion factor, SCO1/SenC/PrrC family [Fictibacillus solisalsi]
MKRRIACLLSAVLVLVLASCSSQDKHDDMNMSMGKSKEVKANDSLNWKVDSFTYTDEKGKPFSLNQLEGKVWLANFIFTNCETVCPPMTAHMAKLQDMLAKEKIPADIVSFSVDPKRDSPTQLRAFGKKFDSDFTNWHFLTGYSQKEIETFAKSSFKAAVSAEPTSDQFIHGTSFYLVNSKGNVLKRYDGVQNVPFDQIVKDTKAAADQARNVQKDENAEEIEPVKVELTITGKDTPTIKAAVSQNGEPVNDADEVLFELWRSAEKRHKKIEIKEAENGVYSLKTHNLKPGKYMVISHVTARGMHTMPKKEFMVQ